MSGISDSINRYFVQNDFPVSVTWSHKIRELVLSDTAQELNNNFCAMNRAGFYLNEVKNVPNKNCLLVSFQHEVFVDDILADAFGVANGNGYSYAVKKECLVCREKTNRCCSRCRVAHYCSDSCRLEDAESHQKWCALPKSDVKAFKAGIDKLRTSIYGRKAVDRISENWMTPGPDGSCGFVRWSWNKMKRELESEGVHFDE